MRAAAAAWKDRLGWVAYAALCDFSGRPRPPLLARFCAKPFQTLEVHERGEAHLCCPNWLRRPIGRLGREPFDEVWNGARAQEVRRSILDGSFRFCDAGACPSLRSITGPVQRVIDVRDPELVAAIRTGATRSPRGPREVNCAYDRSCNLACPSCRAAPILESGSETVEETGRRVRESALGDVRFLYVTGSGDPFGSPHFYSWLQSLRIDAMPALETLHLHSNGLLWTAERWNALPEAVRGRIRSAEISIDAATAESYALNRRGGSFPRLLENLAFIASLRAAGSLERLTLSMVVQENNFLEMPGFVALATRYGATRVLFTRLENWGTYSEEEYHRRAVHIPSHPRHAELRRVLRDAAVLSSAVDLGNLASPAAG